MFVCTSTSQQIAIQKVFAQHIYVSCPHIGQHCFSECLWQGYHQHFIRNEMIVMIHYFVIAPNVHHICSWLIRHGWNCHVLVHHNAYSRIAMQCLLLFDCTQSICRSIAI